MRVSSQTLRDQHSPPPGPRSQRRPSSAHAGALILLIPNNQDNDLRPQPRRVPPDPGARGSPSTAESGITHRCVKVKALISCAARGNVSSHPCGIQRRTAASRETAPLMACRPENPNRLRAKEMPWAGGERKAEGERPAGHFPCQTL